MTQYRHLYWDAVNKDLRQYSDTELEILSYFLRKRYAALLDAGTGYPGEVKTSGSSPFVSIGTATNGYRISGSMTEPDDTGNYQGAEPDPIIGQPDQTTFTSSSVTFYQNMNHSTAAPSSATINNSGLLYWTSPDLKIGPTTETDLRDTLATHCLQQMQTGDEVGSYRVAVSNPGGGTWSDKGAFFTDTIYASSPYGAYKLWLKTANTTEPSTPDNYTRWDGTNNEIQLESSTSYDATAKLINDVYLNIIARRHLVYNVATSIVGTNKGTFYDKKYQSTTDTLTGPSGTPSIYTRTWTPSGAIIDSSGPYYFTTNGERTPTP
jgi:hypothetical protein